MDHAEDGAVGADAQREGDDGDDGEPRRAPQHSQGISGVLSQLGQVIRSCHAPLHLHRYMTIL